MQSRWVGLMGLVWAALLASGACAVSSSAYQAVRTAVTVTPVANPAVLSEPTPALAGKAVEVDGVISGVIANETGAALLLRLEGGAMLFLTLAQQDPELDVGVAVRALVRVPTQGAMLNALAVTVTGPALALAQGAMADLTTDAGYFDIADRAVRLVNPPNEMGVDDAPRVVYHAPERLQDQPQRVETAYSYPEIVQLYADRICACNGRLSSETAGQIAYHLLNKSQAYGVDPRLTFAMIMQESRFNPAAVSPAGARGLGQLMPGTAAGLGVTDAFDIEQNLDGAVRYLATQLREFGRLSLALAAYNAGPGSVKRYGGIPPYRETRNYVRRIWNHYCTLVGLNPETGEPN